MGWIDLDQDRDQWKALVNTVMNLWVPHSYLYKPYVSVTLVGGNTDVTNFIARSELGSSRTGGRGPRQRSSAF
jgi:hypothetical protein